MSENNYNKTKQNIQVLIVNLKFKEIFTTHYKDIFHLELFEHKIIELTDRLHVSSSDNACNFLMIQHNDKEPCMGSMTKQS